VTRIWGSDDHAVSIVVESAADVGQELAERHRWPLIVRLVQVGVVLNRAHGELVEPLPNMPQRLRDPIARFSSDDPLHDGDRDGDRPCRGRDVRKPGIEAVRPDVEKDGEDADGGAGYRETIGRPQSAEGEEASLHGPDRTSARLLLTLARFLGNNPRIESKEGGTDA
jgi:hypothetical protein